MQDYFHPQMTQQELLAMSSLALAHIGDAVFELLVRTKLCVEGGTTNGRLHQATIALVQAPAQARFALRIQPLLTPEEAAVYRRGRNAHPPVSYTHLICCAPSPPARPSARWCRRCARPPRSSMPSTAP